MLKKLLLLTTIIMTILAVGCKSTGTVKINSDEYAGSLVSYINYSSKVMDNAIEKVQKDLDLDIKQIEILLLMKSDLLAKVPEARKMAVSFQAALIEVLEKDSISEEDLNALYAELNVYDVILRDTVVARLIELHGTLNYSQKEKLASYLDKGLRINTPSSKPVSAPVYKIARKARKMYRELKLTKEQKKMGREFAREMFELMKDEKKTLQEESRARKEELRKLILSDSIEIAQVDALYRDSIALYDGLKERAAENIVDFYGTLSEQQKGTLVTFVSDFELD